jgi:hypothetical protein
MSELSIQYSCSPTVGDYGPLTQQNLAAGRLLNSLDPDQAGVIYWLDPAYVFQVVTTTGSLTNPVDGLLEPTESGGIVTIDTGVALVNGYLYFNDVPVDFDVDGSPGNANATDLIVLRWSALDQSIRLFRKNGGVGSSATLTQSSTTWEIALAEVLLDGSGQFSALTDVRRLAVSTGTLMRIGVAVISVLTNSVTFDNIPPFFTQLQIHGYARSDAIGTTSSLVHLRFNNDSGTNYDYSTTILRSAVTFSQQIGVSEIAIAAVSGNSSPAGGFDTFTAQINHYTNPTGDKAALSQGTSRGNGVSGASGVGTVVTSGWWNNSDPVTRLDVISATGDFVAGSVISLYGIV